MDYTYCEVQAGLAQGMIVRLPDHAWIPPDPANSDYQRYLEWLSAGNVPQPWEG